MLIRIQAISVATVGRVLTYMDWSLLPSTLSMIWVPIAQKGVRNSSITHDSVIPVWMLQLTHRLAQPIR
jgi:hypothetical protein